MTIHNLKKVTKINLRFMSKSQITKCISSGHVENAYKVSKCLVEAVGGVAHTICTIRRGQNHGSGNSMSLFLS